MIRSRRRGAIRWGRLGCALVVLGLVAGGVLWGLSSAGLLAPGGWVRSTVDALWRRASGRSGDLEIEEGSTPAPATSGEGFWVDSEGTLVVDAPASPDPTDGPTPPVPATPQAPPRGRPRPVATVLPAPYTKKYRTLRPLGGGPEPASLTVPPVDGIDENLVDIAGKFHLQELAVRDATALTDHGVQDLGLLADLTSLDLSGCVRLTDAGIKAVARASRIRTLRLDRIPGLGDLALEAFQRSAELRVLHAGDTAVTDVALRALARIPTLTELHLPRTAVDGTGFHAFYGHLNLRVVNLAGSRASDGGLAALGRLDTLRRLDVSDSEVGDRGLEYLTGARQLWGLNLRGCRKVTGSGADALGRIPSLRSLVLPAGYPEHARRAIQADNPEVVLR